MCVVIQGPHASGPIEAGQSAGRATRSDVPESDFILWLIKSSPPDPDEKLTPLSIAKKSIEDLRVEKMRYAKKSTFSLEMVNPLLLEVSAVNKATISMLIIYGRGAAHRPAGRVNTTVTCLKICNVFPLQNTTYE